MGFCKQSRMIQIRLFHRIGTVLNTKKQMTKFTSGKFQKMFHPSYLIMRIQRLEDEHEIYAVGSFSYFCSFFFSKDPETHIAEFANSIDLDEVAHNEPPHLDLHCLSSSL